MYDSFFSYSDVKELVQDCVGGAALQQCKSKIQAYSDQTSSTLKKHVYANYMQFIETAKEISRMSWIPNEEQKIRIRFAKNLVFSVDLESEMYQLSHLLIEQRNILSTLRDENSTDDAKGLMNLDEPAKGKFKKWFNSVSNIYFESVFVLETVDKEEIQNKKALAAIQQSVVGFTGSLENKTFLHEGALIELDPEDYRPICRVYFFLLNDLLIVGKVKHDK